MTPEAQEMIDRAAKRVRWSAWALVAVADELDAAGDEGAFLNGRTAEVRTEAGRCAGLPQQIAADRKLTESDRRVRDGL